MTHRLAVSADGSFVAVSESSHVVVLELPDAQLVSEVGIDAAAEAFDVCWLGARLLVVTRYAADTTVHLLDPHGPESIAEIRLAAPVALMGAVNQHALVIGAQGAAVLTAGESNLAPYQFPARVRPTVAGAAANQLVVAIPGVIEEWDPQNRVPKRRLRLPRPTTITALGGSERVVWMVAQQDPTRVDVLPLINRGQPKTHELPEPIASVSGHPKSDLLVCIGAESGRAYLVDLDGRTRLRTLAFEGIDRVEAAVLVIGRSPGVVAAQRGRQIAFSPFDLDAPKSTLVDEPVPEPLPFSRITLESTVPPSRSVTIGNEPPAPPAAVPEPAPASPSGRTARNLAARFAAIHERRSLPRAEAPNVAPARALDLPSATLRVAARPGRAGAFDIEPEPRGAWRDAVVEWARDPIGAPPSAPAIEALAQRFALPGELVPALVLVYGAHLAGHDGVAPADVARLLDGRWEEALGAGALVAVMTYERSRVRFAPLVLRVLDELPPATGTLVGQIGSIAVLGPCVIVSASPLPELARAHAARAGGAILAAHDGRARAEVCFEARALGVAPMLRAGEYDGDGAPAIYVAGDERSAPTLPRFV